MFKITDIDCEPITINANNEICLPEEVLNIIGENWVWDVFCDGNPSEVTIFKRNNELVIRLSPEDMVDLAWKVNQKITWETEFVDDDVTGDGPSTSIHLYS